MYNDFFKSDEIMDNLTLWHKHKSAAMILASKLGLSNDACRYLDNISKDIIKYQNLLLESWRRPSKSKALKCQEQREMIMQSLEELRDFLVFAKISGPI